MDGISPRHPRAESLRIRKRIADGFDRGLVVAEGLAAHGRGEAFDYLLGERTTREAKRAIRAAAAALVLAEKPVISVNGNTAALVPEGLVELARVAGAKLEVNLFHGSREREMAIARWLHRHGAGEVLGVDPKFSTRIREIHSHRRKVDKRGIAAADVVLVPLEDGDRTEALKRLGKRVIAVDLNPMSRTARAADITIVDNIVRAMPLLIAAVRSLSRLPQKRVEKIFGDFDNSSNLRSTLRLMLARLRRLAAGSLR
ncbi:MAG: phosphopantothenate/pantothenate synthetase [Hadesarchaea archaeon]|nr:phosphopantothenate/pantothenate synthetase [Hadesarchaea archaeon]